MTFLDEDDRQGAIRVAKRAVVRAALALFVTFAAPMAALAAGPLYGLLAAVSAVGLAISAIVTLSHPQASVIGGLRTLGFVLAGLVILAGALEVVGSVAAYLEYRHQQQLIERMERH